MNPLFIVDGYSILFRTYYSVGDMTTSGNVPIGGVFGFIRSFLSLILRYNVESIVIALDSGKKTFRSELFSEYKANRIAVPETLVPQFAILDEFLTTSEIANFRKDGYEADDIIASIVKNENTHQNIIVTSDKDLMQLISDTTHCLDFFANKLYKIDDVIEKFGVEPCFITDYLAIVGDRSDNVPGIKGCGPKCAISLIKKFGTMETILANIPNIENPRIQTIFKHNTQLGLLSKQLVTLDNAVSLDYKNYKVSQINLENLIVFLEKYEMHNLKHLALKLNTAKKHDEIPPLQHKQCELF